MFNAVLQDHLLQKLVSNIYFSLRIITKTKYKFTHDYNYETVHNN